MCNLDLGLVGLGFWTGRFRILDWKVWDLFLDNDIEEMSVYIFFQTPTSNQ